MEVTTFRRAGQRDREIARQKREKKIHRADTEKERRIKRLVYHKTRKRNEDGGKVLKHDQEEEGGRERKTEWERKACIRGRAYVYVCVCVRAGVDAMNERGDGVCGRRTGARGSERQEKREHVLLSASRVKKARGNFQVLKRPLITRDRV